MPGFGPSAVPRYRAAAREAGFISAFGSLISAGPIWVAVAAVETIPGTALVIGLVEAPGDKPIIACGGAPISAESLCRSTKVFAVVRCNTERVIWVYRDHVFLSVSDTGAICQLNGSTTLLAFIGSVENDVGLGTQEVRIFLSSQAARSAKLRTCRLP